jgi:hypothetical protein
MGYIHVYPLNVRLIGNMIMNHHIVGYPIQTNQVEGSQWCGLIPYISLLNHGFVWGCFIWKGEGIRWLSKIQYQKQVFAMTILIYVDDVFASKILYLTISNMRI